MIIDQHMKQRALLDKIEHLPFSTLPSSARYVLYLLAHHIDTDFSCVMSVKTICNKTSLSESTVRKSLKHLKTKHFLTILVQYESDGSQICSKYVLNTEHKEFL